MRETITSAAMLGGAFFQVRVGTPRILTASISNRAPGAHNMSCICCRLAAGHAGGVPDIGILSTIFGSRIPGLEETHPRFKIILDSDAACAP
jgi:hypothetical protein